MISEHSPIRDLSVRWKWIGIKSWLATEFSRHKYEKYITTQRDDRTPVDRNKSPQDTPVDFTGDANSQHLIDMMRKRLCVGCAHPEAVKKATELKRDIYDVFPELSDVLQKNCVYRCGCPEMGNCKWFENFVKRHPDMNITNIQERYDYANKEFWGEVNGK